MVFPHAAFPCSHQASGLDGFGVCGALLCHHFVETGERKKERRASRMGPEPIHPELENDQKVGRCWGGWKEAQPYLPEVYRGAKLPKYPIAIDPELTAQRMVVQRSHFTIHGSDMRSMEEMREEVGLRRDLFKVIIDIDGDGVDYLKWHLTLLGITETALFPDLEGLARELRSEYGLDKSRPIS
jgi:hypothetical protein